MTEAIAHEDREHAICSASGSERGLACLGSVAMCAKVPQSKTSDAAKTGTTAHELAEKLLIPLVWHWNKTGDDTWDTAQMMDFTIYEDYPREMWEHCVEYARLIWDNVRTYKPKKVFLEQKVTLNKDTNQFGTTDTFFGFRYEGKKILSIWDLKYGKKYMVEANSPQLIYYACAVKESMGLQFDEAWLNIYQPRGYPEHPEGAHRVAKISYKELNRWVARFLTWGEEAPKLIGLPTAKLLPHLKTGKHCVFCDGKIECPAYANMLHEEAGMDFMDDPDLLLPATGDQQKELLAKFQFDPERAGRILAAIPKIKKFCNAFEEASINFIQSGGKIPGHKVVQTNGRRGWKPETSQVIKALKELGVEDPYDKKIKGLGIIETQIKAVKGCTGKEAKAFIAPLVVQSTGSLSLVEMDDPRPAIAGPEQAALDFGGVSAEEQFD